MFEAPTIQPCNRERRFFGIMRESPAFHFYLLQLIGFLYVIWRFASRNYSIYGFLPDDAFDFPRGQLNELLPIPSVYFTTFQFIYELIPRPSPEAIKALQYVIISSATLGLVGILPRWNALLCFLIDLHITGWIQSTNADMDGGSQLLWLLLIMALCPASNFYGFKNGFHPTRHSKDYHWPIFLLFLIVSLYYTFSGIGKFVDSGTDWFWRVRLDNLGIAAVEDSLFVAMPYTNPLVTGPHITFYVSVFLGVMTLVFETFFIAMLWFPRYRPLIVFSMMALHTLVLMFQGLNFLGNLIILALCIDWNVLARRVTVLYDGGCGFCQSTVNRVGALDWLRRMEFKPIDSIDASSLGVSAETLKNQMAVVDENGEVYYGADAFEQLCSRSPLLLPFAILMKVPGVVFIARPIYTRIAKHREHQACSLRIRQ